MFGIRRPVVRVDVVAGQAFDLALIFDLLERWSEGGQFRFADQQLFLARGRVHRPELTVFARVVALDEGELRGVGIPLDGFGRASSDAAGGEDGFDGEGLPARTRRSGRLGEGKLYKQAADGHATDKSIHRASPRISPVVNGEVEKCTPAGQVCAGRRQTLSRRG